ncbi:MAG: hypothetical protein HY893_00140 [Deltaproteobacteria bacterium]|nr:hypothetical protein [Deltaproteobacteria bacterium]
MGKNLFSRSAFIILFLCLTPSYGDTKTRTEYPAPNGIDVKKFGAVPNDGNDDSGPIQAALDAANAASPNTPVYICGVYNLSRPIHLYSDMSIEGCGSGFGMAILRPHSSMKAGEYLIESDSLSRVYIRDLTLQAEKSDTAHYQAVNGIKAYGLNRWQVDNVILSGFDAALDIRPGSKQEANNGLFTGLILEKSRTGLIASGQDLRFIHPTFEQNTTGFVIGEHNGTISTKDVTIDTPHLETNQVGGWVGTARSVGLKDAYAYYSDIYLSPFSMNARIEAFQGINSDVIDTGVATSRRGYSSIRQGPDGADPLYRESGLYGFDCGKCDTVLRSALPKNPDFSNTALGTSGWTAANASISIPGGQNEAPYGPGGLRIISTSGAGYAQSTATGVKGGDDYLVKGVYTNLSGDKTYMKIGLHKGSDDSRIAESAELKNQTERFTPIVPGAYSMVATVPAGENSVRYRVSTNDTDAKHGGMLFRADLVKSILRNGGFDRFVDGRPEGWQAASGMTAAEDSTAARTNRAAKFSMRASSGVVKQTGVPVAEGHTYLLGGYIKTDSAKGSFEIRWGEAQPQRVLRGLAANALHAGNPAVTKDYYIPFVATWRVNSASDNVLSVFASNMSAYETFTLDDFYMVPVTGETTFLPQNEKKAITQTALPLSDAPSRTIVMTANANFTLRGARVIYDEGTSADAGVTVSLGVRRGDASTNSYYASMTTEPNRLEMGSTPMKLSNLDIREGDVIYAYTSGGKTGSGRVLVEFEYE